MLEGKRRVGVTQSHFFFIAGHLRERFKLFIHNSTAPIVFVCYTPNQTPTVWPHPSFQSPPFSTVLYPSLAGSPLGLSSTHPALWVFSLEFYVLNSQAPGERERIDSACYPQSEADKYGWGIGNRYAQAGFASALTMWISVNRDIRISVSREEWRDPGKIVRISSKGKVDFELPDGRI